jgi:hypothetical protein
MTWLEEDEAARRLAVDGFMALWCGERRFIADLTDEPRVVDDLVAAGRLEVDEHGVLIGVHGLVTRPTRHRIAHTEGAVNTWCALDAIGIPAALGIDADAITSCPACEAELRVTLHRGVPSGCRPVDANISSRTSVITPTCTATTIISRPPLRASPQAG